MSDERKSYCEAPGDVIDHEAHMRDVMADVREFRAELKAKDETIRGIEGNLFECRERIAELEGRHRELIEHHHKVIEERDAALIRLISCHKGLLAVTNLISESHGVAGLHRNGDVAAWDELLAGGRFEDWLRDFSEAIAAPVVEGQRT